jgi:hypothetical protein
MIIKNLEEAKQIEKELKKNPLYSIFFHQWSNYWFQFIKKNDKKDWNWDILTENINVSFEVIKDNIEYPWSNRHICLNENITYANVVEIIEKNIKCNGNQDDIMFENMDTLMSFTRNMDIEDNTNTEDDINTVFVISGLDREMSAGNINIDVFSGNKNFTTELIEKNPKNIPINYHYLSSNPNVSQEYFIKNIHKDWNMWSISKNSFVTFEFILQHPELEWDYHAFMLNPNCSLNIILDNPDKGWDIEYYRTNILENESLFGNMFEMNPMITWEDICECKNEVSYSLLSTNHFTGMRVNWIYHQMKERKNIYQKLHQELIQKTWAPNRFLNWCLDYKELEDLSQK